MVSCLVNLDRVLLKLVFLSMITLCTPVSGAVMEEHCQLKLQFHKDLINDPSSIISKKYSEEISNLELLLAKVGCELVKVEVPPGRGFMLMEAGQLDVMIAISKNAERQKNYHFIGPHGRERNWLIGPKSKLLTITNFAELERSKLTMSAMKSAFYGKDFEKMKNNETFNRRLFFVTNNKQKIDLLIKGRVDLTVENEYVIEDMVRTGVFEQLNLSKLFLVNDCEIYYAFSKKSINPELAIKLQKFWHNMNVSES